MSPDLLRAAFRIGTMLVVPSVVLLFLLQPGSAEYAITVVTLIMGLAFAALITALAYYMNHR
jgi:diacylglycerol kinase